MIFEKDRLAVGKARYSLQNASFKEEDHPRAEDGKFGKGGGTSKGKSEKKKPEKKEASLETFTAEDGLSVGSGNSYVSVGFDDTGFHIEQDPETGEKTEVYDEFYKLDHVYVEPSNRGKGLAKKMIREAVSNILKKNPEARITLAALPEKDRPIDQEGLVGLYRSLGFEPTKEQGSEAVAMEYTGSRKINSAPQIKVYRAPK